MKSRFLNKINHLLFGKSHNKITLSLISKPGKLNYLFGKTHRDYKKINVIYKKY